MAASPQVLFADCASGQVTSGGTGIPATENMTVTAATAALFPAASNTATPPTVFYFADPAQPTETMMCTNVSGTSNTTWAVTRGADGTTAVPHSSPFNIRGTVPAGVLASFQGLLTNLLPAYYKSVAVTPSATSNTYGTAFTFTPPSPYRFFLPLHIFVQAVGIGAETLTVLGSGTLEDGTNGGSTATLTTTSAQVDGGGLLAGFTALSSNASGQTVTGAKRLASYLVQVKSTIGASGASATCALWTALIP